MAVRFCPFCGHPTIPNSSFCASCGAAVGGAPSPAGPPLPPGPPASPPPLTFSAPSPYAPYPPYPPGYPVPGSIPVAFGEGDRVALSNVSLAAILGLVGVFLSLVTLFLTPVFSFIGVSTAGSGTSLSIDLTALYTLIAVGGVGVVLALLELWFYREAFRTLARQDSRFSTPATLTLLAFIALIIVIVALIALVAVIYQAILCVGSGNPITSECVNVGAALGLFALMVIAGIILLIGYIGLLIGIWRLGTRYGEVMFKVAAVLLIFPVLNIVALILILLGTRSAREKLGTAPPAMSFG